jgi:hypothetical protein
VFPAFLVLQSRTGRSWRPVLVLVLLFRGATGDNDAPTKNSPRESSGLLFPGYYNENPAIFSDVGLIKGQYA